MGSQAQSSAMSGAPISSSHQQSRPAVQGTSAPVRLTTITCSIEGHSLMASSALALRSEVLPARRPWSIVMSTRDWLSCTRWRRASAENPPKTTLWGSPSRAQASMATGRCHTIGR